MEIAEVIIIGSVCEMACPVIGSLPSTDPMKVFIRREIELFKWKLLKLSSSDQFAKWLVLSSDQASEKVFSCYEQNRFNSNN